MANLAWAVGDAIVLGLLAYEWVSIRRELARDAEARAREAGSRSAHDAAGDGECDDDGDPTPVPVPSSAQSPHAEGQHPLHARMDEARE